MNEWVALVRLTVGLILLLAALGKLMRPSAFVRSLAAYRLVPTPLLRPAAALVIAAEAALAAALLVGVAVQAALLGAAILVAAFAAATALALRREGALDCGCLGGIAPLRLGWLSVGTNVALSVAAFSTAVLASADALSASAAESAEAAFVLWSSSILLAVTYWLAAYAQSVVEVVGEAIASEAGE